MSSDDRRYHYGPSGEYRGFSTNRPPGGEDSLGGFLLLLASPFIAIWWFSQWAYSYPEHAFPGNIVAFFYYWTIVFPFSVPFFAYYRLTDPGVTPFTNINFLLGAGAFLIALLIVVACFAIIVVIANEANALRALAILFVLPGVGYLMWLLVAGIFSTLFSWLFYRAQA